MIGRINIMKMTILPIYRFKAMPIRIPTQFFTDLERTIFTFIWKCKKSRIARMILKSKRISGGVTIPDLKPYYQAIVT